MKTILSLILVFFANPLFAADVYNGNEYSVDQVISADLDIDGATTMTGPLTLSGSSLTVTGAGYGVLIGTVAAQAGKLDINGLTYFRNNTGTGPTEQIRIGRNTSDIRYSSIFYDGLTNGSLDFRVNSGGGSPFTAQVSALYLAGGTGSVGINTITPASTLSIGTPLNSTTSYMQVDTLLADTAGPPAATDCDASTEVGRMVVSSRYTATASNFLWVCMQTAASTFAWWKTELTAP